MLGGAQSEENSLAQSSQDLRVDSGNLDETEDSLGILPENDIYFIEIKYSGRCQLTRSVRIKDRSPITPVARPELPFQVVNMDLIGPIDPPSSKGHKYILCLVDQHTRWGEAMPVTSLSAKVLRMLEQFVVSRIVDIDILMQIWKNRVKQINFVLEWVRWVGSEFIPAKGKLEP
ncbi:retrovirus-related Pol polyprotein from transposon opus [Trichonephila clavipes]|nr:retrovirus-related Pol polyprotein from transposon opus [Trichonephila clavipes]